MLQIPQLDSAAQVPSTWRIPPEQWNVYAPVMRLAEARKIPFALGGGLAFSYYARRWRNTKDIDLYVRPSDREAMIQVATDLGLKDYFSEKEYDRAWIHRTHDGQGNIVDIIWQMANYRAQVDDLWLVRGESIAFQDMVLKMLPVEELIWAKLFVLQRERCDWGDLLNILYARAASLDWDHLLNRVGDDVRVLSALMQTFLWLCPGTARRLSEKTWARLGIADRPENGPDVDVEHVRMLDSREWFGPDR